MKRVSLVNRSPVQKAVKANNGETYWLRPRGISKLPKGVDVEVGDLPAHVKRTVSEK